MRAAAAEESREEAWRMEQEEGSRRAGLEMRGGRHSTREKTRQPKQTSKSLQRILTVQNVRCCE